MAWIAAWLGWTLDAFDFTIFLLLMVPIAEAFNVSLVEVTAVFTITLWLRLVGAVGSGWLADRIGRKTPPQDQRQGVRFAAQLMPSKARNRNRSAKLGERPAAKLQIEYHRIEIIRADQQGHNEHQGGTDSRDQHWHSEAEWLSGSE
jgi:hypothetical protein